MKRTIPHPLVLWCRAVGLPEPVREFVFASPRKWRFDYAWTAHKLAIEVEGGVWSQGRHTRGRGFVDDMNKYNRAALDGWCLLRCTPKALLSHATLEMIREALTAPRR